MFPSRDTLTRAEHIRTYASVPILIVDVTETKGKVPHQSRATKLCCLRHRITNAFPVVEYAYRETVFSKCFLLFIYPEKRVSRAADMRGESSNSSSCWQQRAVSFERIFGSRSPVVAVKYEPLRIAKSRQLSLIQRICLAYLRDTHTCEARYVRSTHLRAHVACHCNAVWSFLFVNPE
jgi:hypothetical protein